MRDNTIGHSGDIFEETLGRTPCSVGEPLVALAQHHSEHAHARWISGGTVASVQSVVSSTAKSNIVGDIIERSDFCA
jgi:hypothetical protein